MGLSEVTLTAQPSQILLDERTPQSLEPEHTGHVDSQSMVEFVRRPGADLAHRPLQFGRFLTRCNCGDLYWSSGNGPDPRCNAVCVQTVEVPRQVDGRDSVPAPATDAADGGISPPGGPENESPGVLIRMPPVVNRQPSQPATSPGSCWVNDIPDVGV